MKDNILSTFLSALSNACIGPFPSDALWSPTQRFLLLASEKGLNSPLLFLFFHLRL